MQKSFFPIFTNSLMIREWTVQDGKSFYKISQDKELNAASSVLLTQESQDDAERKVIEWALITAQTKMGYFPVFLKSNTELIGLCRLKPALGSEKMNFEVTCHLIGKYLGKGFSDEATMALSSYAKDKLGITEVCIRQSLNELKASLPEKCKILAVSKLQSTMKIRQLHKQGQKRFAENYVQEALEKQVDLKELDIEWHFIGHLQKNKVKQIIGKFELIHSIDSEELAQAIDKHAATANVTQKILLQVNLAGEETKSGFSKEELTQKFSSLLELQNIKICGLMTMPPLFENPEDARPYFKELQELQKTLLEKFKLKNEFCELSMGTSSDFRVAAEEGSTFIRLGTILFGERN